MQENNCEGVLAEYSRKVAQRELKRQKRQTAVQAVKYFLCAASAGVLQLVTALLLRLIILEKFIGADESINFITNLNKITFIADTVGLCVSILWNFTLNRKFTFKSANNVPLAMALAFMFYIPFYPFQIWYIDTVEKAIAPAIGDGAFVIAQGTCMLINFTLEFLWQKFVVFRKKKAAEPKSEQTEATSDANQNAESENEQAQDGNAAQTEEIAGGEDLRQEKEALSSNDAEAPGNSPETCADEAQKEVACDD